MEKTLTEGRRVAYFFQPTIIPTNHQETHQRDDLGPLRARLKLTDR
jgi:hypothetical protein